MTQRHPPWGRVHAETNCSASTAARFTVRLRINSVTVMLTDWLFDGSGIHATLRLGDARVQTFALRANGCADHRLKPQHAACHAACFQRNALSGHYGAETPFFDASCCARW